MIRMSNLPQKPGGILRTDAEHVLDKLLRDGGRATGLALHGVLQCSENALEVDAVVTVETFVLGGNERLEKDGVDGIVWHRRTVLAEKLSHQLAVGTVNLGSCRRLGVHDFVQRGRLAKEPEKVDRYGKYIK
mgnify:CR=1 FL=1